MSTIDVDWVNVVSFLFSVPVCFRTMLSYQLIAAIASLAIYNCQCEHCIQSWQTCGTIIWRMFCLFVFGWMYVLPSVRNSEEMCLICLLSFYRFEQRINDPTRTTLYTISKLDHLVTNFYNDECSSFILFYSLTVLIFLLSVVILSRKWLKKFLLK